MLFGERPTDWAGSRGIGLIDSLQDDPLSFRFILLCGIILWVILNFFNPYSAEGITAETIIVTFIGLGLPAIIGLVASVLRKEWLMYLVSVISLPLSAFLSGSPSIFKLFILVTMSYLVSAILFTRDKRNNKGADQLKK